MLRKEFAFVENNEVYQKLCNEGMIPETRTATSWDKLFFDLCDTIATKSKDRSAKVGSVIVDPVTNIVVSMGYNGFPRGADDDPVRQDDKALKLRLTAHAEANAICSAARLGHPLDNKILYCNKPCCLSCVKLIIQSGIDTVYVPEAAFYDEFNTHWVSDMYDTLTLVYECNIELWLSRPEKRT